jgi:hypothetical protein
MPNDDSMFGEAVKDIVRRMELKWESVILGNLDINSS